MNGNGPGVSQTGGTPYNQLEAGELAIYQAAGQAGALGLPLDVSDGYVYMGTDYEEDLQPGAYVGSTVGSGRQDTAMFPVDRAISEFYFLDDMQYAQLINQTTRLLGYDARKNISMVKAKWEEGVLGAAAMSQATGKRISPFGFLQMQAERNERLGLMQARGGGGGGSRAVVNLTNPDDAQVLVDNALQNALGRAATAKERNQFLRTLNQAERQNPVVSGPGGTSGGINRDLVAKEFARARPDAAEYLANTQYTDWMQELLSQEPMGGIESGL